MNDDDLLGLPLGKRMEWGAISLFADYLRRSGRQVTGLRLGDARAQQPDGLFDEEGVTFGIEVTGAHYDENDARELYELLRDVDKGIRRRSDIIQVPGPDEGIVASLQSRLEAKCLIDYGQHTYLLLDARADGLHGARDAPMIVPQLVVPAISPFDGIYVLLARDRAELSQVFPVAVR